MSEMALS